MSYILASASPRRKELFSFISRSFEISPADIDETIPEDIEADGAAEYLASAKAAAVAKEYPDDTVIGCDTVVIADGTVLGKPADTDDARRMLKMLSGTVHSVITGVCIISGGRKRSFSEKTLVEFYPLSDKEIEGYIATGDPMDKAGAYGIQTEGCMLVKRIDGDFFNVVGLPVSRLYREIAGISEI